MTNKAVRNKKIKPRREGAPEPTKAPQFKGGEVGSMAAFRDTVERKGGTGGAYILRIPADGILTVRFLAEPDNWYVFYEHYDDVRKFYACRVDNCPGCQEGDNPSRRYLAPVLNADNDEVVTLKVPASLASAALRRYDRYDTLTDRDYDLERSGSGLDTEYDIVPADTNPKRRISDFEVPDLGKVMQDNYGIKGESTAAPADDDDDDEPTVADVVADEDDYGSMTLKELRAEARKRGIKTTGKDMDDIISDLEDDDAKVPESDGSGPDEPDEDEEDEDDGASSGGVSGDGAEDEDDEYLDEDEIRALPIADLRALAKDLGLKFNARTKRDVLISRVLDYAEEEA